MATEYYQGDKVPAREDNAEGYSFDELAKGLASGRVSRGRMLRLVGGALLGGLLAAMPGVAAAAPTTCPNGERKCGSAGCCQIGERCVKGGGPPRCATVCPAAGCGAGFTCCCVGSGGTPPCGCCAAGQGCVPSGTGVFCLTPE